MLTSCSSCSRSIAWSAVIGFVMLTACAGPDARVRRESRGNVGAARPNVVLVLLDDLEFEGLDYMPRTLALVRDSGVTMDQAFVTSPLCCPSRVTLLRGQYPHNSGVVANGGRDGGFPGAYRLGVEQSTLATWLSAAGYRTAIFGKYLNDYPRGAAATYVPPGWTEWGVPVAGSPYSQSDYTLNLNGRIREFGHDEDDYGTDVYVELAEAFIRRSVSSESPFFLLLSSFAPHSPATPAPRHRQLFGDVEIPARPSRGEADMSDKPPLMRDLPLSRPRMVKRVTETYRNRLRSLQAVDEGVERLIAVLRALGELESTVFIVTSDNGFHLLDHRLPQGKETAYETDIHVPLVARGPGIPRGVHSSEVALNNDLAPTIADIADAPVPDFVDGRSLLPALTGAADGHDREGFLVIRRLPEHLQLSDPQRVLDRLGRMPKETPGGVPEFDDLPASDPGAEPRREGATTTGMTQTERVAVGMIRHYPHFNALRSRDGWSYIEHDGGFVELYDLTHDPDQMDNLAVTRPTDETRETLARFARWTRALMTCKGSSCREIEDGVIP